MKRFAYILLLLAAILPAQAQTEGMNISFDGSHQKDFGGFILDMSSMLNAESLVIAPLFPSLNYIPDLGNDPNVLKINPDALKFNPSVTYFGGTAAHNSRTGILSLLHPGMGNGPVMWQGASYRLNNGVRINTYGEYDADGNKRYNPSALPWQRNDFNAAFEVKSPDGKFGIKLEVSGGRTGY